MIVVHQRGFSKTTSAGGDTWITYGLVLFNRSHRLAARNIVVKLTLADASGRPLVTDQRTLTAIPARGTFYVGGETTTTVPAATVAKIQVRTKVGSRQKGKLVLPKVRDTTTTKDQVQGWRVSGVFTNPYKKPIYDTDGSACAVVFSASGRVLGGYCEPIGEAAQTDQVPPGATVGVAVSLSDFPQVTAKTAFGRISVDPGPTALG